MKTTKCFVVICILMIVLLNGCTGKQEEKVYRVGVLSGLSILTDTLDGFKEKMTELGYIEGKNIVYDVYETDFDIAIYKSTLQKFVDDEVDLIFVFPTEAALEAKAIVSGTGIPIVFANALIEDTGLVNNVREPGGNITGVRWNGPDLVIQRFEILHEIVPDTKRMIIIYQRGYPIVNVQLEALQQVATKNGITLLEIPTNDPGELASELDKLKINSKTDAILAIAEPLFGFAWEVIGGFADKNKIPVGAGPVQEPETLGYEAIFSLMPQNIPQGKQAAFLADKILKGSPTGTLPVITADYYLIINYKAIQNLGLDVPEGLLAMANEIIR